jgi:hypothetical protein
MAEIGVPADFFKSIMQQVDDIATVADEATRVGQAHLLQSARERAAQSPAWDGVGEHIDTWDDGDKFWIGVRGPTFISQAFMAEYGTDGVRPSPVLRAMNIDAQQASEVASEHVKSRLGARLAL